MQTQSSKLRKWSLFVTTLATAAFLLQGCGGGSDGAAGPAGPAGAPGAAGPAGKDLTNAVKVANLSADGWAALAPKGEVTRVTISSPPVVEFKVTDASGNPVIGLGNTAKSSTATVASYPNVAFTLAKLVPGANGSPSKWVSYLVTTIPSTTAGAVPTRPSSDNAGTLVDNGDGSYKYTFYRDITKIKADVDAMSVTAPNNKADLGDLTYEPNLTHRLVVQVYGNARGTGSNTADGSNSGIPAVAMKDPLNIFYDFIPATGKVVTATDVQREIVAKAACNSCHTKIGVTTPHGGRVDPRYCVTCHNDQRKYGRTEATTTATGYSGSTYLINGVTQGNFPNMAHRIHMGKELTKTGYNYANVLFNEITYPQPVTNCVKCHDGSATAANKTAQGDNWKNVPSRLACGACHDGINFATGQGVTLGGNTIGHIGGAKANDAQCILCHDATTIPTYHVTIDPTGSSGRAGYPVNTATDVPTPGYPSGQGPSIPVASQLGNLPAGVYKVNFEISKVTVAGAAGAKKATVVYRILKDGQPVTLNGTGYLMDNVDGTPSIYVAYALPQDGGTAAVDWNNSPNATVKDIRDAKSGNSQTGPDASGYYTATLAAVIPDAAKMVTAAIGLNYQGFVQLGLAAYPKGIRLREPTFVMKTADGYTARRAVVSAAKCNSCHGQLGVGPSFHGGARNNGEGCAICHTPNNSTGHTGAAYSFGGGWSVSVKNLVHSIHGSAKREQAFSYEATAANPNGFKEVTYPAILNNCEQCHVAGSYDFSAAANSAAVPGLLWTTEAKTDMTNAANVATLGLSPWITALGRGQTDYRTDNLVSSPISSSCFGCHDSKAAVAHIQGNGGSLYASASTVTTGGLRANGFNKTEACLVCHGSGKVADIKTTHMKF
ncbi:MAG: OmcA/MtrC family decaheme c-type cytochrome [Sterolibacterium sp.]